MVKNTSNKWNKRRKRIFQIIEVGNDLDTISRIYDFINVVSIILNILASILYTYSAVRQQYGDILLLVEGVTVAFFTVDYILRLFTARYVYPRLKEGHAIR